MNFSMDELSRQLGDELEQTYVKHTYNNIAEEFSGTRYKKWPRVEKFVENLPKDSLLLDVGCGNGKYLDNNLAFSIGCDASQNLLSICRKRGFEVVLCDMTRLPLREDAFDAIICIAALHHVVTTQRRQKCLKDMTDLLTVETGKILVQVWAFEQNLDQDNPYLKKTKPEVSIGKCAEATEEVCFRETIKLPVHENRTPFANQDLLVPFKVKKNLDSQSQTDIQHLRYYHVFKENELNLIFKLIDNMRLLDSYYDRGNWCAIALKKR